MPPRHAQWAKRKGFASLIVVTSDYHMPRSMVELAEAMPDMRLIAYPVSNPELHLDDWWRDPDAFGLLAPRIRQIPARGDAAGAHPAGADRERGGPLSAPARMTFLRSLLFNVAFYLATIAHPRSSAAARASSCRRSAARPSIVRFWGAARRLPCCA